MTFFVNFLLVLWQLSNQRADFEQEKEAMEETVRSLAGELRLHQLVIDAYIPDQYQQLIHSHSTWNEDTGEWHLVGPFIKTSLPHVTLITQRGLAYAGNNVQRPQTPPDQQVLSH